MSASHRLMTWLQPAASASLAYRRVWCGALVTLQVGVMLDCFTDSLGSLPNYRRKIGCRDGIRTRECQVMSLVT